MKKTAAAWVWRRARPEVSEIAARSTRISLIVRRLAIFADAALAQFIAIRLDTQAFRSWREAEAFADALLEKFDVLVLKLNDPVAVDTDQMVVVRMIEIIGIV